MTHTLVRRVLAGCSLILLTVTGASAQVFGTFSWQMQPYCNIVSLTLTQTPGGFTVDGSDNQCGAAKLAGAAGMALFIFNRHVAQPLERLQEGSQRFAAGDLTQPIADNSTAEGRALNRRVVLSRTNCTR